jgi:hypothetical protein
VIALAAALVTYLNIRLRGRLDARLMVAQGAFYAAYVGYVLVRG